MDVGEHDLQVPLHPVVLLLGHGLELDGERGVGPGRVLADEAVGLQPTGEGGLGRLPGGRLGADQGRRPATDLGLPDGGGEGADQVVGGPAVRVQVQAHARPELVDPQPGTHAPPLGHGVHQVVGGRLDERAVAEEHPEHALVAVGLDCPHPGLAVGVVDDGPDGPALDQLADRHHAARGADQRVVRLAGRALRLGLDPDVEPDRGVEGGLLVDQQVGQLGLERLGVVVGGEVAVLGAPAGDRTGDPVHHLAYRVLTLRGAEGAAEVLLGDDVGGVLRPGGGELEVALLEGGGAIAPVGDDGVPTLPGELVVGVGSLAREQTAYAKPSPAGGAVRRRTGHPGSWPR